MILFACVSLAGLLVAPPSRTAAKQDIVRRLDSSPPYSSQLYIACGAGKAPEPPRLMTAIVGDKDSATVPFLNVPNPADPRVYFETRVNGKGPFVFMLDTGSTGSVISEDIAEKLALPVARKTLVTDAHGVATEFTSVTIGSLDIGDVRVSNLSCAAIGIPGRFAFQGVLGREFIEAFVISVDYAGLKATFTRPTKFDYKGRGDVLPITFQNSAPFLKAELDGIQATLLIDSGANGGVVLFGSFVTKNVLRKKYPKHQTGTGISATGSTTVFAVVRPKRLMLGGKVNVTGPIADLRDTDMPDGDGWIGAGVLRKFTVILDYQRERIILEKNRFFDEPEVCSLTGWEPLPVDDGYAIRYVFPDSPASRAGLKVGDSVVEIGGYAAKGMAAATLHGFLRGRPGTKLPMTIMRDGKEIRVVFTLKDVL